MSDDEPTFDRHMIEALVCPLSQGPLTYDAEKQELVSKAAKLAFPIRGGIPVMLIDEARKLDG
ncbi:Trm112 family protein [Aliiroseovarius subalbicans]|uniref:Trm112 family protein n=1 Tax=Aliiroseovarius subalbicans TaxID=2925840 RepID=UPI001F57A7E4|nr:Trm112 family protein [Aliiroseovarius subalbicans]MCI2400189.1 Trm112 family protein [Aliiroseovarius subalbicans]